MLSLSKHLYRGSNLFTYTVEMLRQAQHDVLLDSIKNYNSCSFEKLKPTLLPRLTCWFSSFCLTLIF